MERTALPATKSRDNGDDERSVLLGYLTFHRIVLARKLEGLGDDAARRAAAPPSPLNVLGLVRHMTDVERLWFRNDLLDEGVAYRYTTGPDDERDLFPPPGATVADALADYWEEIATVDAILDVTPLDRRTARGGTSLRRVVTHMIEEYARHCGHADLLREAIDGVTGD